MAAANDDDDPVIDEVDVYLSKQLMETLFLFQYPVRPAHLTYDNVDHLSVKMKPKQQKVEMEMAMNTTCPNYSRSKGEQIAVNVDGAATSSHDSFFASGCMDKQTVSSNRVAVDNSRYAIGLFKDNELHLNPVKGIIQMRASFSYLDKGDVRMKAEQGDAESSQEDEEEAKPVTVKFARHETEEAKARRMASYEYLKKMQEEEKWVNMRHHSCEQQMAEAERSLLISQQTNEVSEFYISSDDYLTKLIQKHEEKETEKPALPNNVLSMTDLKSMNLSDQVKSLLISAKVIRFSQLMTLLPKSADATAVLRCLQHVALMVQGSWVVKSEILYPADSSSAFSGVPAEVLCRGRDYIMWRFTQNRFLVRKDISSVIKLHAEDVKDILEQMSRLRVHKGWEFLLDYDSEFVNRHPEVVQRQQMLWKAKFDSLSKVLKVIPVDMKMAAACVTSPKRRRTVSRNRTKSGGMSDLSDNDLPPSEAKSRPSTSKERKRQSSGEDRHRANSFTDDGMDIFQNGTVSISLSSPTKTTPGSQDEHHLAHDTMDEIRKELCTFVREKISTRTVLKLSDLRTGLNFKLAELPAGHALGKGVSDSMLLSVIRASGAIEIPQVVTKLQEPLFINCISSDKLNHIRSVVVDMLKTSNRIIVKAVRAMVDEQETQDEPVSEADVRKVVKEYCTSKGSNWILKGTLP